MFGLTREIIGQIVLLLIVVANAALFGLGQIDRQTLGDRQNDLSQLERALRNPVGRSNPEVLRQ